MQLTVLQDSSKTFFSIFGESCAYGKMQKNRKLNRFSFFAKISKRITSNYKGKRDCNILSFDYMEVAVKVASWLGWLFTSFDHKWSIFYFFLLSKRTNSLVTVVAKPEVKIAATKLFSPLASFKQLYCFNQFHFPLENPFHLSTRYYS